MTIERTRRRFEKYDKGAKRALKDLAKHERAARRMDKAIAKAKAEAADAQIGHLAETDAVIERPGRTVEQTAVELGGGTTAGGELTVPAPQAELAMDDPNHPDLVAVRELLSGVNAAIKDDGIPQFLKDAAAERARKLQAMPDPKTLEKKRERRAIEKEVRQAELTGKRRRMPPQGRAALDAIRKSK